MMEFLSVLQESVRWFVWVILVVVFYGFYKYLLKGEVASVLNRPQIFFTKRIPFIKVFAMFWMVVWLVLRFIYFPVTCIVVVLIWAWKMFFAKKPYQKDVVLIDAWKDCLHNLEDTIFNETWEKIKIIEKKDVNRVIKLFIKYKVDPQKIMSNVLVLLVGDLRFPFVTNTIKSNKKFLSPLERPQSPIWFLAWFPDVIVWYNKERCINNTIDEKDMTNSISNYMSNNNISDHDKFDDIHLFDLMVSLYKEKTWKSLEINTDISQLFW